ncbi:DgyrCDS8759 [Dimorphilus gyrociliatus]|uniref:DgyrCDS8759 n=1 Tax=Dimorphilus gyrociliatus TaxID=2664684 RepID=A0A7I8VXF9_9ANNE|nr:DgyrCDS8759 [Dimorphilus gyrociliatus]
MRTSVALLSSLLILVLFEGVCSMKKGRKKTKNREKSKVHFSTEYDLVQDLLTNYDPIVRPRYNSSETVVVRIRFSLQQIYDLDEKRQILAISGWLTAEWLDEFLMWDPEEYGNISSLVLDPRHIWTPSLAIGNSADRMFQTYRHFWITVRSTGEARWQPGGTFAFTCALDMNYYPFDNQYCTMEVETWHYNSEKLQFNISKHEFGLETYLQHGEWEVYKTLVRYENVEYKYYQDEQFPEVFFSIFIRRKYTFYFMYILLPCIMLSFVLLMTFLLPADSGEKVNLGVSILVAFSVSNFIYINSLFPLSSFSLLFFFNHFVFYFLFSFIVFLGFLANSGRKGSGYI